MSRVQKLKMKEIGESELVANLLCLGKQIKKRINISNFLRLEWMCAKFKI